MFHNERDKSYIYDILKYSQEVIDILKDETHHSFVNNRIKILTDRIWLIASESIPELMYQIKSKNFI